MSQGNVEIVETMCREFTAGNVDTAIGAVDPKMDWNEGDGHPDVPPVKGIEAVKKKVFKRVGEDWPGLATVPLHFVNSDDFVVVLGKDEGEYRWYEGVTEQ